MTTLDKAFEAIFKKLEKQVERNTANLTLYPAGVTIEPYVPSSKSNDNVIPEYTPGPRKLSIEEYRTRIERRKQSTATTEVKPKRGGRRKKAARQLQYFKLQATLAKTKEEQKRYLQLAANEKRTLNNIKHRNRKK